MNTGLTPEGTDLNGVLVRIEQTASQIGVLETVLEDKRNQLHLDFETLDRYTRPMPRPLAIEVTKVLNRCHPARPVKSQHALIYKGERYPCRHYKDWFVRLCQRIREDYSDRWSSVVSRLNSGCNTTLRVAQTREALLPGLTADLRRAQTESIGGGWYVSKRSLDEKKIEALVKILCASLPRETPRLCRGGSRSLTV